MWTFRHGVWTIDETGFLCDCVLAGEEECTGDCAKDDENEEGVEDA